MVISCFPSLFKSLLTSKESMTASHHSPDIHYTDVIMGAMASQITSLTIDYSTVYSCANQRKHQSSASLAFVRGIHRGPVNSPHKWPVTRKMFPFDDVIMMCPQLTNRTPQKGKIMHKASPFYDVIAKWGQPVISKCPNGNISSWPTKLVFDMEQSLPAVTHNQTLCSNGLHAKCHMPPEIDSFTVYLCIWPCLCSSLAKEPIYHGDLQGPFYQRG